MSISQPSTKWKFPIVKFVLLAIIMLLLNLLRCHMSTEPSRWDKIATPTPATNPASIPATQSSKIVGDWHRGDGYRILVTEVAPDGKARASYFNPQRQINVGQAFVKAENGVETLTVVLRDTGYPGSRYTLQYDKQNDLLTGEYFQATEQQTYDVSFQRAKAE